MAKTNKKYLLIIPPALVIVFLWFIYAFSKAECICPWNQWGFSIATITAVLIILFNLIIIHILINKKSKKFNLYYAILLAMSVIFYIIIMRIFMALLT